MNDSIQLQLKPEITKLNFLNFIKKEFKVKKVDQFKKSVLYLDTFDWRLYKKNLILKYEESTLQMEDFNFQKIIDNIQILQPPVFIDDFPESDFKQSVKKIIRIRALLPVGKAAVNCENYRLLNSNEKTILRLRMESVYRVGKFIFIEALKGYSNQLFVIRSLLKTVSKEINQKIIFEKILDLNNKSGGDYDSKINVQLHQNITTEKAAKLILKNLAETLVKNEPGIINDVDTEFLHDFRVASRRTRSAFSQIKNVFPVHIAEKFNCFFTTLGKRTNKLRDLDVYLLKKTDYLNKLPANMRKDLLPFFMELQKERKTEVRKIARFLKSASYKNQMKEYLLFLDSKVKISEPEINTFKPVKPLAIEFIQNQYKKVMKRGIEIEKNSPDILYHKLRIQCKKLRYLLEFFSSLFAPEKISILVSHLRKLQDHLGLFNDLSVQQETLKKYSQVGKIETNTILALGYLIGKLNDEQLEIRITFQKTFKEFSSHEILFNEIFVKNKEI